MYPNEANIYYGIFVKEQIEALYKYHKIEYDLFIIEGYKSKLNYIHSIPEIKKLIKKNNYDLIHIHYGISGIFLLFSSLLSVPVVLTLHGGDIQKESKKYIQVFLSKLIAKKATIVITLNQYMDRLVKGLGCNTQIIPCSVNTKLFNPTQTRTLLCPNKPIKIIFSSDKARMVKNYPLFASVLNIIKQDCNWDIDEICLTGMTRKEVSQCMQTSNLLLLTSVSEGSPQVIKEAMSCNLPIVSTNVGNVVWLLEGVRNAKVSTSFNARELADLAIDVLLGKVDGIDGRDKLMQLGLDEEATAHSIFNLYKQLLTNKNNGNVK